MLTVLHMKSAPDIFLMYLITDCDVMASAQANALTDFNAEGCCGKCIFSALDDFFYLDSLF